MKPPAQPSSCLHCRSDWSAHSAGSAVPLRLHAVSACASTQPLSGERGSAAATVTRLSGRAPSAVPPCPSQPTPPLDRIGRGSPRLSTPEPVRSFSAARGAASVPGVATALREVPGVVTAMPEVPGDAKEEVRPYEGDSKEEARP
jgi:hypothetical protein